MSKDNAGGGFLSKMAQIVKRPSAGWNELDGQAGQRDSQYSKQVLAEMIERKRRNDFVRKREFDMLRKLRNRINDAEQIQGGRPSFFQSSYSSKPDDNRAGTLKKINEIEEQMAQQWWKTRQGDSRMDPRTEPPPTNSAVDPRRTYHRAAVVTDPGHPPTRPMGHMERPTAADPASDRTQQLPQRPGAMPHRPVAPPVSSAGRPVMPPAGAAPAGVPPARAAMPLARPGGAAAAPGLAAQQARPAGMAHPPPPVAPVRAAAHPPPTPLVVAKAPVPAPADARDGTSAMFSASKFYALDVQELALDPDIEEASIRFASGDDAAAEQGLLDLLKREGGGTVDEWLTLFDLYRAIGKAAPFESLAIDFANRFSTSAPQWFSMKDEAASRAPTITQATSSLGRATWMADQVVEAYAVTVLTKLLERTPQPWVLDWKSLERIDPAAVPGLLRLFQTWATSDVDVRFVAAAQLRDCLQQATTSGNATVDRVWWELRLLALRVMNMGDEFEMTALDYCVTYEVSPPSWEPAVCRFRSLHSGQTAEAASAAVADKPPMFVESQLHDSLLPMDAETSGFSTSQLSLDWPVADLDGEVLGDPQAALDAIDKRLGESPVLVVSCKYLIRVDFSAAGGLLNWASGHQRSGRQVRFTDVHRLIAAFFHVVGVTESAKIQTRSD